MVSPAQFIPLAEKPASSFLSVTGLSIRPALMSAAGLDCRPAAIAWWPQSFGTAILPGMICPRPWWPHLNVTG